MNQTTNDRVKPGDPAPDFSLPDDNGNVVRLSDLRGRKVVLFMYPKDNTPGCTAEACDFRDNIERIQPLAVVLGLSPDSVESHARFKEKHQLPYPLLADTEKEAAQAYGAWVEKSMFGRKYWGIERSTFIIDEEGILTHVFRRVKVNGHVAQVLEALKALEASGR